MNDLPEEQKVWRKAAVAECRRFGGNVRKLSANYSRLYEEGLSPEEAAWEAHSDEFRYSKDQKLVNDDGSKIFNLYKDVLVIDLDALQGRPNSACYLPESAATGGWGKDERSARSNRVNCIQLVRTDPGHPDYTEWVYYEDRVPDIYRKFTKRAVVEYLNSILPITVKPKDVVMKGDNWCRVSDAVLESIRERSRFMQITF